MEIVLSKGRKLNIDFEGNIEEYHEMMKTVDFREAI